MADLHTLIFTAPDGKPDGALVNLDQVESLRPTDEGVMVQFVSGREVLLRGQHILEVSRALKVRPARLGSPERTLEVVGSE